MSEWDVQRARQRGDGERPLPRCSRCGRPRVLNPCRDCATLAELTATRTATSNGRPVVVPAYPALPARYR